MRFLLFLLPLVLLLLLLSSAAAGRNHRPQPIPTASAHLARSCSHATYPTVCIRTLSTYGGAAETPRDLAKASVAVTLTRARRLSDFLAGISDQGPKSQRTAVGDCVDQISDSVDELSRTLGELKHLRPATFEFQMSNAQTWVSAALTYDDTCLDGLEEVQAAVKADVKRRITNVAKVTSNALYMIHRLDESRRSNP